MDKDEQDIINMMKEYHSEIQNQLILGKLFIQKIGRKPKNPEELYHWFNNVSDENDFMMKCIVCQERFPAANKEQYEKEKDNFKCIACNHLDQNLT